MTTRWRCGTRKDEASKKPNLTLGNLHPGPLGAQTLLPLPLADAYASGFSVPGCDVHGTDVWYSFKLSVLGGKIYDACASEREHYPWSWGWDFLYFLQRNETVTISATCTIMNRCWEASWALQYSNTAVPGSTNQDGRGLGVRPALVFRDHHSLEKAEQEPNAKQLSPAPQCPLLNVQKFQSAGP